MTDVVVRYSRAGGRPPADDERLEVHANGTFKGLRTVGGARIGSFAGRFAGSTVKAIGREVAACRRAGDLWLETPRDGATVTIELGGAGDVTASMDSNARPGGPWGALARRLSDLLKRATEHPGAAVELVADARQARLVALGPEPLEVDVATIEVRLVRLDATGQPTARWGSAAGDPAATSPRWQRTGPGWSLDLPFDPAVAPARGDWLQVWVLVTLRAGGERRGRLFLAVPGG
jgi:hypothetical protein